MRTVTLSTGERLEVRQAPLAALGPLISAFAVMREASGAAPPICATGGAVALWQALARNAVAIAVQVRVAGSQRSVGFCPCVEVSAGYLAVAVLIKARRDWRDRWRWLWCGGRSRSAGRRRQLRPARGRGRGAAERLRPGEGNDRRRRRPVRCGRRWRSGNSGRV